MADKNISVRLGARVDAYVAAMRTASASTTNFSRQTQRNLRTVGTQMQNVGRTATMFLSVPIVAAGAFAVKAAIDWESAWAGVTKTVDGTAQQLDELEQGLRDMSKELPATHAEIAAVAEAAGALGVATEDIEFFTRVMLDLGETTDLSSDQAATSIAQLMNVMQTAPGDVDNLGAALVHLGNNGASTESQILDMATRIAAAGEIVGLSESDVLGFANALASMGIEAEAGGSAFSRVITDISKAVAQGGEDLDTFAEVAGMSASSFATSFREDPSAAIVSFVDGLGRVHAAGGDVFTVLDELGLSDVRVSRALLSMATSGDLLTESLAQGAQGWQENTALADEAAKRYETAGARFEIVRNKLVDLFIDLGEIMLPVVEAAVDAIGLMAEAFQGLPQPVQIAVGGFLALVAVMGPMTFIAGSMLKNFTQLAGAFGLSKNAATTLGKTLGALGVAASLALLAYGYLTQEERETEQVTRDVSAALLTQFTAFFAAADAASYAAGEIDGVTVAQQALSAALSEGHPELADSLAELNIGAEDTLDTLMLFSSAPVSALNLLAQSFGFTATEAAGLMGIIDIPTFGLLAMQSRELAGELGISEARLLSFGEAWYSFIDAADNDALNDIAQEFLNGRVRAEGYEGSLVAAAEATLGIDRQTGDAMAVLMQWALEVAGADEATRDAVLGAEGYGAALAELPPELQALIDPTNEAAAATDELAERQASAVDTSTHYQKYLADIARLIDEFSTGLDTALGGSRDWVRAHEDFQDSLRGSAEAIEHTSGSLFDNTDEMSANRDEVLGLADDLIAMTESNIQAGWSQERVNAEYAAGREALLDAAEAAGLNRGEVDELISTYGLVPELVSTAIEVRNLALRQWQMDRWIEKLESIPEEEAVAIEAALNNNDVDEAIRILQSIPDETVGVWVKVMNTPTVKVNYSGPAVTSIYGIQLAEGGLFNTPTPALIGEAGPEVVLPLNDPSRMSALLGLSSVGPRVAAAFGNLMPVGGHGGGSFAGGGDTYNTYEVAVNMPPGADGDDVVRALKRWERQSGPLPFRVRAS